MRLAKLSQVLIGAFVLLEVGRVAGAQNPAKAKAYLDRAAKYLEGGNLQKAEEQAREAVALDPGHPEGYTLLGFVCDQTARPEEANQNFRKALELNPKSPSAHNNLGSNYFRQGRVRLAREQYEQALRLHPDDLTATYNLGLISFEEGDKAQAVNYLEKARSISPEDQGVLFNLARAYFAQGRREDGLKTALQISKSDTRDEAKFVSLGILLLENRYYGPAVENLSQADKLSPHNPAILLGQAQAYLGLGQSERALASLEQSIDSFKEDRRASLKGKEYQERAEKVILALHQADPASQKVAYLLGEILFLGKKYADAIQVLKPLTDQDATNPDAFNLLGMSYVGLDQFPSAAEALIRAIGLAPGRSDLYFNLASIYQKAGDNEAAIKILKQALSTDRSSPQIFFALGLSYFNLGNFSAAIDAFERALDLQPDFEKALLFVGRAYAKWGKLPEAIKAYQKALAMRPEFYPAHFQLALALLRTGRTEEAVPFLEQVVRLNPDDAEAYYYLGKVHSEQGRFQQAQTEFEKAIAIRPGYDDAYYQLGRLYAKRGDRNKAQELFRIVNERKQKRTEKYQEEVSGFDNPGEKSPRN